MFTLEPLTSLLVEKGIFTKEEFLEIEHKFGSHLQNSIQVAIYLAKILSGEKGKEIGQHFGTKGPAISDAIKRIEGRMEKESKLRERVEFLKGSIVPEF